jgi:cytochrome c peroxidase
MDSTCITPTMGNSDKLTLSFGCIDYYTSGYSDLGISVTSESNWRVLGYRTEVYEGGAVKSHCNSCMYGDTYYQNYCSKETGTVQSSTQPLEPPTPNPAKSPTKSPKNSPAFFAARARSDIADLITSNPILAPKFVRMGFHDCVGGCDGCIDLSNPDNNGLDTPISALDSIVQKYTVDQNSGLSRADIWALAALTAADMSQSDTTARVDFPFSWIGRKDCEKVQSACFDRNNQQQSCSATRGPHRELPSADSTMSEVLHFFSDEFGFDASQTVALMGAHSLGSAHRQNSGYDGPLGWVPNNLVLSNSFYQNIVGGSGGTSDSIDTMIAAPDWTNTFIDNSDLPNTPDEWQWEQNGFFMLHSDIALVRDFSSAIDRNTGKVTCSFLPPATSPGTGCPFAAVTGQFVAQYKNDEILWLSDFRDVFTAVLTHGFDTSVNCGRSLCLLGQ